MPVNSFDTDQGTSDIIIILKPLLPYTTTIRSNNKERLRCWRMPYAGIISHASLLN